ncbi:MAG TPA: hypothetical protein VKT81_20200, partial [Bryobacteraceae bacterium]|nr:hypothetical protein [Bryobacteraceae bacterium]
MLFRALKSRPALLFCGLAFYAGSLFGQPSVLTWHNDNARSGHNLQETILTPANVNSTTFGKLFIIGVDGKVDGQPLYVPHLTIPGQGLHNVLYIATEHDSVYAVDADNGTVLKARSMLVGSEITSDTRGCSSQVNPEIGITSTPVIDPNMGPHGTIYVVAMSRLVSGGTTTYHHRLHALDLTTLAEEFGGPVEITATYPGNGDEKFTTGTQTFMPAQHKDRAALLLANGIVYTAWSSHCDASPYTSWIIGYNESTLAQATVINLVPNGSDGAFWSSGGGPQADAAGNVYIPLGNGTFGDGSNNVALNGSGFPANGNYGNAYVKLSSSNGHLAVADYFTMHNSNAESGGDVDLGSGGGMLLPPLNDFNGHSRNLAVVAGKDTNIYVMDTAGLGKYNPSADEMYQELDGVLSNSGSNGGMWGSPAWFNGWLYYGAVGNPLKAFQFQNGRFVVNPSSQTTTVFSYPGTTPSVSANNVSNGIVWAVVGNGTAVLHAYDATNLAHELYNSQQATGNRDAFGSGNKFVFPTIVNGKVYVASNNGKGIATQPGSVAVFGLLSSSNPPPASLPEPVSVSPSSGSGGSGTFAFTFTDPAGAADIVSANIEINAMVSNTNSCNFVYTQSTNSITLADNSGTPQAPLTIGSAGTSQNSQCSIDAGASSVSSSGNLLTLTLAVTFTPAFDGAKFTIAEVQNASRNSGWAALGSWTVTSGPPPPPPSVVSVTPNSGSGSAQTFSFLYTDTGGASTIASAQVMVNSTFTGTGSCYLFYVQGVNQMFLASDAGVWQGPLTPGASGTLQNSQCALSGATSSVLASGNNLTVNFGLTFAAGFAGAKNIYAEVRTSTTDVGWFTLGTYTVTGGAPPPPSQPSVVSVTPNAGSGATQTFSFAYTDPAGAADIASTQVVINSTFTGTSSCYLFYVQGVNQLYLASDGGVWQGPLTPGVAGTLQNSQCTLNAATSSVNAAGNNLTVNFGISFAAGFAGAKNIYAEVRSGTKDVGWSNLGTFTVTGGAPPPSQPSVVSVTPNSGSGATQVFSFAYTDPAGAVDIASTQVVINSTFTGTNSCYLFYVRGVNQLYLASDGGVWQGPLTPGVAGTLQNSQ